MYIIVFYFTLQCKVSVAMLLTPVASVALLENIQNIFKQSTTQSNFGK